MQNVIFSFITSLWMNTPAHWNFQAVSDKIHDNVKNFSLKPVYLKMLKNQIIQFSEVLCSAPLDKIITRTFVSYT